ncbi:MAG: ABC transporter permease [Candidatus Aenigmatarchaeota archaeon]
MEERRKMKWSHISAMVKRDFLLFIRMKWRLVEFLYFPLLTVLTWGLFSVYMQEFALQAGLMVLAVNIIHSFAQLAQSTTNSQMMEDVWSGSFKQILVSGITEGEYIISRIISSTIASVMILLLMVGVGILFGLNVILQFPLVFAIFSAITLISSIALSIIIVGLILILGRSYGFLSYSMLSFFVLFSAPFYPVDIFPSALQVLSYAMPYTHVFIGIRSILGIGPAVGSAIINGFVVSFIYLVISIPIYAYSFHYARKKGNLARMV